jgi:hypothetical protein
MEACRVCSYQSDGRRKSPRASSSWAMPRTRGCHHDGCGLGPRTAAGQPVCKPSRTRQIGAIEDFDSGVARRERSRATTAGREGEDAKPLLRRLGRCAALAAMGGEVGSRHWAGGRCAVIARRGRTCLSAGSAKEEVRSHGFGGGGGARRWVRREGRSAAMASAKEEVRRHRFGERGCAHPSSRDRGDAQAAQR